MRKLLPDLRASSGFTIMELMVVMTVMAILATMALFGLNKAQASARDSGRQQIMTGIAASLERYYGDNQQYPNPSANSGYDFGGMVVILKNGGYLAGLPVDPDPKCTTAVVVGDIQWSPCGPGAPPAYFYVYPSWSYPGTTSPCPAGGAVPQTYQLVLLKEAGGVSYFCPPQ